MGSKKINGITITAYNDSILDKLTDFLSENLKNTTISLKFIMKFLDESWFSAASFNPETIKIIYTKDFYKIIEYVRLGDRVLVENEKIKVISPSEGRFKV